MSIKLILRIFGCMFVAIQVINLTLAHQDTCNRTFSWREALDNFSTLNFPKPYPNKTKCSYTFKNNYKKWLIIKFSTYDLYNDVDNVTGTIGNSSFISYSTTQDGKARQNEVVENPRFIYSNDRTFTLEFNGLYNPYGNTGFQAKYEFRDSVCDEVFEHKRGASGTFSSVLYPDDYPEYLNCTYQFKGKPKERVQIIFSDFSLSKQSINVSECEEGDSVLTYRRYENEIKLCGDTVPRPILSDEGHFAITFAAGPYRVSNDTSVRRFKASYNFTTNYGIEGGELVPGIPGSDCLFLYNSSVQKSGFVNSPNFPGLYPSDIQCNYDFVGESTEIVLFNFTSFNLPYDNGSCSTSSENDYVSYSDMANDPDAEQVLCGWLEPFEIRSNSTLLFLIFRGQKDRHEAKRLTLDTGFMATYQFIGSGCEYTYNSMEGVKSGTITSFNYPQIYPDYVECTYYFNGQQDEYVLLNFTEFHLPDHGGSCSTSTSSDYLSYSDGRNDSSTEKVFCGSEKPPVIRSNSSSVRLIFKGGKSEYDFQTLAQSIGFVLNYEFININPTTTNFACKPDSAFDLGVTISIILYIKLLF